LASAPAAKSAAGPATKGAAGPAGTPAAPPSARPRAPDNPFLAGPVLLEGDARAKALALASDALNAARAVQGRFLQMAPDGSVSQGAFYLQRPGKLRFEYDAPATMTIVADGSQLSVVDRALKTDERYPLRATPLYFVLKNSVALDSDGKVTKVVVQGDTLQITVRDRKGQTDGSITLMFDQPSRELRQWRVVDGQGQTTQVVLRDITTAAALDPKLFALKPYQQPGIRHP
jgi:outer membrane lipoprotein-sorting protein